MRLVIVSTYPPRRCGLATFTQDLRTALRRVVPGWQIRVVAMDSAGFTYPHEVFTTIDEYEPASYRRAADAIAAAGTDLVLIQHEYGIFGGGPAGRYVLDLTRQLAHRDVPYALTLHTVEADPTPERYAVLRMLCAGAAAVTVFSPAARAAVVRDGLARPAQTSIAPHGGPVVLREPWSTPPVGPVLGEALAQLGPARLLTTFGFMAREKGLENVIAALPAIAEQHPDVRYVIAGATHPEVLRRHGESYRQTLRALAAQLGVADRLCFIDAFLTEAELSVLLSRTTLYLTPYPALDQTCSGTLAFALTAGCAVISTPYQYAQQMVVPPDRPPAGLLVPPRDHDAIATAAIRLLDDPSLLANCRASAHAIGAQLTWPAAAARFRDILATAVAGTPPSIDPARALGMKPTGARPNPSLHTLNTSNRHARAAAPQEAGASQSGSSPQ